MPNDNLSAGDRWARTVAGEIRRHVSLRPRRGRKKVLRYTPMPPEVRAGVTKALGVWPLPQSKRDETVDLVAKKMSGNLVGSFTMIYGTIPEPEASRAAAALEAEAFAAASAFGADKDLSTDEARFEVFQMYGKDLWARAYRYAKSRPQAAAAGTSRAAGPAALLPPPAASVAVVSGPVQQLRPPSAPSAPRSPPAPEE